jgi:hypothetical protein
MAINKSYLISTLLLSLLFIEVGLYFYASILLKLRGIALIKVLSLIPIVFILFMILIITNSYPEKWIHDAYKM